MDEPCSAFYPIPTLAVEDLIGAHLLRRPGGLRGMDRRWGFADR